MTDRHRLTVCDLSGDIRDWQTLLFRTEAGAKGYAASRGCFYGMHQYKLNGRQIHPDDAFLEHAERPVGYEKFSVTYLEELAA